MLWWHSIAALVALVQQSASQHCAAYIVTLFGVQVIKLISQVIADFANGEISQQQKVFDSSMTLDEYMDKNFYKTASLIAASCKSAAVFSGCSQDIKDSMFEYGRHLGLAFQVIDDILDFTQTAEQLGKPQVRAVPTCVNIEQITRACNLSLNPQDAHKPAPLPWCNIVALCVWLIWALLHYADLIECCRVRTWPAAT